jgi:regulator of protease activity HflC (stomatin/prohibitin superfamily)
MSTFGDTPQIFRAGLRAVARAAAVGLLLLIVLLITVPSSFKKTDANEVGLSYGGGVFEGRHYQRQVNPGSGLFFNGVFDKLYRYPSTQRNYIISLEASEGDREHQDSIQAPSSDGVQITYQMAVTFKLNTNPEKLRKFHEQLGLKYHAYDNNDGWDRLLNDTMRQQIENATQRVSRRYTSEQIYRDTTVVRKIEGEIGQGLKEGVNVLLGDNYFCGPTFVQGKHDCPDFQFVIKKTDVPAPVRESFEKIKIAQNAALEAAQNVERAKQEALAVQQRVSALTACVKGGIPAHECVLYQAVEKGGIEFWVMDGNGDVNVTRPRGTTP